METNPIKTYRLYIKSHCTAPDFEVEVEATSKKEALKKIRERWGRQLCEWSDEMLLENMGVLTPPLDTLS